MAETGSHVCSICKEKGQGDPYSNLAKLEEHVATEHFDCTLFECLNCSSVFYTVGEYVKHLAHSNGCKRKQEEDPKNFSMSRSLCDPVVQKKIEDIASTLSRSCIESYRDMENENAKLKTDMADKNKEILHMKKEAIQSIASFDKLIQFVISSRDQPLSKDQIEWKLRSFSYKYTAYEDSKNCFSIVRPEATKDPNALIECIDLSDDEIDKDATIDSVFAHSEKNDSVSPRFPLEKVVCDVTESVGLTRSTPPKMTDGFAWKDRQEQTKNNCVAERSQTMSGLVLTPPPVPPILATRFEEAQAIKTPARIQQIFDKTPIGETQPKFGVKKPVIIDAQPMNAPVSKHRNPSTSKVPINKSCDTRKPKNSPPVKTIKPHPPFSHTSRGDFLTEIPLPNEHQNLPQVRSETNLQQYYQSQSSLRNNCGGSARDKHHSKASPHLKSHDEKSTRKLMPMETQVDPNVAFKEKFMGRSGPQIFTFDSPSYELRIAGDSPRPLNGESSWGDPALERESCELEERILVHVPDVVKRTQTIPPSSEFSRHPGISNLINPPYHPLPDSNAHGTRRPSLDADFSLLLSKPHPNDPNPKRKFVSDEAHCVRRSAASTNPRSRPDLNSKDKESALSKKPKLQECPKRFSEAVRSSFDHNKRKIDTPTNGQRDVPDDLEIGTGRSEIKKGRGEVNAKVLEAIGELSGNIGNSKDMSREERPNRMLKSGSTSGMDHSYVQRRRQSEGWCPFCASHITPSDLPRLASKGLFAQITVLHRDR